MKDISEKENNNINYKVYKDNKSYVEKFYINGKSSIEEVKYRLPELIKNDGEMIGFRFFNQEFLINGKSRHALKKYNFSEYFYFGKRLNLSEVKEQFGNNKDYEIFISNMENNGYDSFCYTQVGILVVLEDGDQIYDEYYENKKQYMNEVIKSLGEKGISYEDFLLENGYVDKDFFNQEESSILIQKK